MTLTVYNNNSEPNKIKKDISRLRILTGNVKEENDIENPEFLIEATSTAIFNSLITANYAYVTEYKRYYFIVDRIVVNNKLLRLKLKVDVLMSFQTDILNTPCLIERSAEYYNKYITDNQQTAFNYPMVLTKAFSSSFDSAKFYLTVASSD